MGEHTTSLTRKIARALSAKLRGLHAIIGGLLCVFFGQQSLHGDSERKTLICIDKIGIAQKKCKIDALKIDKCSDPHALNRYKIGKSTKRSLCRCVSSVSGSMGRLSH
jgi:hypothetical protein